MRLCHIFILFVETNPMQFDPDELEQSAIYKLLSGAVIPRPIGWVSSISEDGIPNLAPFSFFNVVGDDPPHVMFSTVRTGGKNKDTLNNVLATKQFVANMVTEDIVEKMNKTAEVVPSEVNEFELGGLTPVASAIVKPPRVLESPINFECELVHHYALENSKFGGAVVMIGKVVMFHFAEGTLTGNFHVDLQNYRPVARLAGSNYARLGEIFSIKRL